MTATTTGGPARRGLLASAAGAAGAFALAGWSASDGSPRGAPPRPQDADPATSVRPFRGEHQGGIADRPQTYAAFAALDLRPDVDRDAVRRLFTVLTDDIERLMTGAAPVTDQEPELAAVTAGLTVTVGVGPALVARAGATVPAWLAPLPAFSIDRIEERWSGGDLLLQLCAESPTTLAHAQRRLLTAIEPLCTLRWVQRGFREPFEGEHHPMRNLMGQVDGTVQPEVAGRDAGLLWCGDEGPAWLVGGSALVLRRIRMTLDTWDRVDRLSRENAIGRRLDTGAPVTAPAGATATAIADLNAKDSLGFHVIDDGAHLRRAHAMAPHERFLRRPYSYDDAPTEGSLSDSGLLFAAFMADPVRQFVPVQQRLADKDLLNLWTTPVGSAVFAILPGARDGELLGERLFA
ncbi:MAG: Dyp-type peroxidase [Actinobacteria bacterium]|nr:Dyp-type peroxidase [Actinomycetota bacterium]